MKTFCGLAFTVALLTIGTTVPAAAWHYDHDHMWGGMGGWHGAFLGPLIWIVFLGIVIALIVLLVRWVAGSTQPPPAPPHAPPGPTPLDILKERLAKGEIDAKDYEARRKILEG